MKGWRKMIKIKNVAKEEERERETESESVRAIENETGCVHAVASSPSLTSHRRMSQIK